MGIFPSDPDRKDVWVPDKVHGYIAAYVVQEKDDQSLCCLATGNTVTVPTASLSEMNPPKFDKAADIADLTHLNEASVVHNLRQRYFSNLIYTYSGLFLVAVNPYHALPIYTEHIIEMYKNKRREENPPHIFAVADGAMQNMLNGHSNQSLLITGESGAGKTENTKRVIQYLAATAMDADAAGPWHAGEPLGLLERQILQANPILESFGNAQTVRNNNSSRFGKFIKIEFSATGTIAGGNIEWYLLEKSRVHSRNANERNFHIFYQLLRSRDQTLLQSLKLSCFPEHYAYLANTRKDVEGIDDSIEFSGLLDALRTMGFTMAEEHDLFRVIALILHLGNIELTEDRSGQARITNSDQLSLVSELMGVDAAQLNTALVRPTVRAGREAVSQQRTKKQVTEEVAALCKTMYEKTFGWLVDRINLVLDRPTSKSQFIGVLDIAGFEIFDTNSFEQLCINYTNEKLQQFFNHHMFMLEQQEYAREMIQWDYMNFGLDLQPTIHLIESTSPIGILAALDEECIMPRASDDTFTEKLTSTWSPPKSGPDAASSKFLPSRQVRRFIVRHYAANVEYSTDNWLDKNRDPLNDHVARVLATSAQPFISSLFAGMAEESSGGAPKSRRGTFRTVGQRHKEQLVSLMAQLDSTQPHFVRCIVPNTEKRPGRMELPLVLDQLRCNGVLEGIRIARLGFPNRLPFTEFVSRYALLASSAYGKQSMDGRVQSGYIAESIGLDPACYKIGLTKIFFKAGVLAELEEQRDAYLHDVFTRFQASCHGYGTRRIVRKRLRQRAAKQVLQESAREYKKLESNAWWRLYMRLLPLLAASHDDDEIKRHEMEMAVARERALRDEQEKARLVELESRLTKRCDMLQEQLDDERTSHASTQDTLNGTKQRLAEAEAELNDIQAEREGWSREANDLQRQMDEGAQREMDIQAELASVCEQLNKQLSSRAVLEREHSEAVDRVSSLETMLDQARVSLDEHVQHAERHIEDLAAKHEAELHGVRTDLELARHQLSKSDALSERLAMLEAERQQLQEAHISVQATLSEREAHFKREEEKREALQGALASAQSECAMLHEKLKHMSDKLRETNQLRDQVNETYASECRTSKTIMTERDNVRSELSALRQEYAKEKEEMQREIADKGAELKKAHSKAYALESENRRLETMQNKTTVEHVHVLEEAKKYTDRQLSDVQNELQELSTYTRSLERTRARMQQGQEVLSRTVGGLSIEEAISQRDEARSALEEAEKTSSNQLKMARAEYETRIKKLEDELRRMSKNHQTEKALTSLGSGRKSHAAAARQVLAEIQMETELLAKDLARASSLHTPSQ